MFKDFVKAIQKNLQQMSKDSSRLFTVNVDTEIRLCLQCLGWT